MPSWLPSVVRIGSAVLVGAAVGAPLAALAVGEPVVVEIAKAGIAVTACAVAAEVTNHLLERWLRPPTPVEQPAPLDQPAAQPAPAEQADLYLEALDELTRRPAHLDEPFGHDPARTAEDLTDLELAEPDVIKSPAERLDRDPTDLDFDR